MGNRLITTLTTIAILAATAFFPPSSGRAGERYAFGGGPAGGTFQFMAAGIASYPPVATNTDFSLVVKPSAGSVENLRKVDSGRYAMAVVYSGELYMGRNGLLKDDSRRYENVLAVSYFYGAPAQLVVHKRAGVDRASRLAGLRVGVGNVGSGAFANCERLFSHLGIWERVQGNAMGYNDAAIAFADNKLDAFWLFVGYPAEAIVRATTRAEIELVDLYAEAEATGFFRKYPFFTKAVIPAGTYKGIDHDVISYQDSALWVANKDVPAEVVYALLAAIYSDDGLAHMRRTRKTAAAMRIADGIKGIVTPLHPGAEKFWREKGLLAGER